MQLSNAYSFCRVYSAKLFGVLGHILLYSIVNDEKILKFHTLVQINFFIMKAIKQLNQKYFFPLNN
jgi:hypothetical protein